MLNLNCKEDEEFESILKLSQVTLSCKREEIDKVIDFLNKIKDECANETMNDAHWHYRDYNDSWTEEESDFIISLNN